MYRYTMKKTLFIFLPQQSSFSPRCWQLGSQEKTDNLRSFIHSFIPPLPQPITLCSQLLQHYARDAHWPPSLKMSPISFSPQNSVRLAQQFPSHMERTHLPLYQSNQPIFSCFCNHPAWTHDIPGHKGQPLHSSQYWVSWEVWLKSRNIPNIVHEI